MPRSSITPAPGLGQLTRRDTEILIALTRKVRLLSTLQLARTWWNESAEPVRNARRRLKQLESAGLVQSVQILSRPELPLPCPLAVWNLQDPSPDFPSLAYKLQSRWTEPAIIHSVFVGTRKAANLFGGKATRLPREAEQTHDLHLGALYLEIRTLAPELAESWISDELIRRTRPDRPGEKLPDALTERAGAKHVIEFGGAYSKDKLQRFHGFCRWKGYSYEIW